MSRWILAGLLILGAVPAHAATFDAASCTQAAVTTAMGLASDGDTVRLPSPCSGSDGIWTGRLDIDKAIHLTAVTPCALDANLRPSSCSTVIIDGRTDYGAILSINLVSTKTTRVSNIKFAEGMSGVATEHISVCGINDGNCFAGGGALNSARYRIDHCIFDQLLNSSINPHTAIGVIDHNWFNLPDAAAFGIYTASPNSYDWADARWAAAASFGSETFTFIENNSFTRVGTTVYFMLDSYSGARNVVRFNDIQRSAISAHGTESSGRSRGTRAVEVYKNNFTGITLPTLVDIRSGANLTWGNAATTSSGASKSVGLDNERTLGETVFGVADGTNPWDHNAAHDAYYGPYTVTTGSTSPSSGGALNIQTVTVSGAGWSADQFKTPAVYSIHKVGCISFFDVVLQPCGLLVWSNTATTITYTEGNFGTYLNFSMGDQFTLQKITDVLDAPCRGQGTLLQSYLNDSITRGGGGNLTATVTTHASLAAIGLATNDYIYISDASPSGYRGTYQITATGANTYTYTLGADPGGNSGFFDSTTTKVPTGWNDQVTEKCYQWLNTNAGSDIAFTTQYAEQILVNEHYYDYSASFTGASGMGSGVRGSRPATCTIGVAYWSIDQGSWNSSGAGGQGVLDKCTGTNTWTNAVYVPYDYPYPGTVGSCTPDHLSFTAQPASVAVNVALGTVSVGVYDSGNSLCASATDTITIANKGGTCSGMTLGGTKSGAASSGVFTTTNLTENVAGSCTLSATASGLTGADSSAFTISALGTGGGIGARLRLMIR